MNEQVQSRATKSELYGIYEVNTVTNYKSNLLWEYLLFERVGSALTQRVDNSYSFYQVEIDTASQKVKFSSSRGGDPFDLYYKQTGERFDFHYILKSDTIVGTAKQVDKTKFQLVNRGFNWINERPYNR